MLRPPRKRDAGCSDRVPEPGAVEVGAQALPARPLCNRLDVLVWLHAPAAAVVRVFQGHQASAHVVGVTRADHAFKLVGVQYAVAALKGPGGNTADLCVSALFVVVDMAFRLAEHFIARAAVNAHADQVRHGSRGNK